MDKKNIIGRTKSWIERIVVGLNFCPFAANEMRKSSIRYVVVESEDLETWLNRTVEEFFFLKNHPETETTFLIFPKGMEHFEDYLGVLDLAETLLVETGFEGIFQIASFHPDYQFDGNDVDDAANCTNRSPFPMFHLLREHSVERAVDAYPNIEEIPKRNADKARELGLDFFEF